MAKIDTWGTKVEVSISLVLPEDQARALKWVCDYGADNFMKFAEGGGLEKSRHQSALKELVSDLRAGLSEALGRADKARDAFKPVPPKPLP